MLLHPLPVRERNQRGPEIEPEVDGELGDVALLRDMAERLERLLEVGDRLTVRGAAHRPESRLAEIADCLLPHLAVQGMVGEPFHVLGEPVGVETLEDVDDPGVQGPAPLLQQRVVRHLIGQRMLERVFELREQASLIEELAGLQMRQSALQGVLGLLR